MEGTAEPTSRRDPAADRISRNRNRIAADWSRRSRLQVYPARKQLEIALIDSMPVVLDKMAEALRLENPETCLQDEQSLASAHGVERAGLLDYSLNDVLLEYFLLRQVIFDFLDNAGGVETWERDRILDIVQLASRNAASAFAQQRQAQGLPQSGAPFLHPASQWISNVGIALLLGVLGLSANYFLEPLLGESILFIPLAVTILSALWAGFIPGLITLILCSIGLAWWTFAPFDSLSIQAWEHQLRFVIFLLVGILATGLTSVLRHRIHRLKIHQTLLTTSNLDLEKRDEIRRRDIRNFEKEREMREKFVAALTHDLRNPIAAAIASAQMIARHPDKVDKHPALIGRIVDSLMRADQMITNLLDANRLHAGQGLSLTLEERDLAEFARDSVHDLSTIYGNRIVVDAPSKVVAKFSPDGMRRIIDNLVTNAAKYGAKDQPITLRVGAEGSLAFLSVHNFGNPLSPEEQRTLFTRFERSQSAQKRGIGGWGLGLTLVRGIAEAHGGTVGVESSEKEGTKFTVRLPLV